MSNYTEQIQPIVGRRVVRAEWTGNLPIDDGEGYLLTFDDGSQILFSWYQAYDCSGVLHELRAAQPALALDAPQAAIESDKSGAAHQ